ncbi:triacylglycerol lipase [Corynebacterium breve]|uniref:Triacylglycerol lipase n=1 Tax=Corynebacterium breve TaxID=3049799 RepID=A0ABY8VHW2_9CORY|nr:triacylglycerol lipase [Corynebacterium breve]WIM67833.1 triacylglycerol lipase [Corynebacterium breve]
MDASTFRDQIAKFWTINPEDLPEELVRHAENVVVNRLPLSVAQEIGETPLAEASSKGIPLVPKVRQKSYFEDDYRPADKPWPVVLIHGTASSRDYWHALASNLREDGWGVYALNFGNHGTGLMEDSATQVDAFISGVLAHTGADKAILIGHSQGGLLARYWMRKLGGATKTKHLVCLSSPNHGTTLGGIASPLVTTKVAEKAMTALVSAFLGPAAFQQIAGSDLLRMTNEEGDVDENVTYTCIATHSDSIVQPPETCFLNSNVEGQVNNMWVQDLDPGTTVLHEEMPRDKRVIRLVRAALRGVCD